MQGSWFSFVGLRVQLQVLVFRGRERGRRREIERKERVRVIESRRESERSEVPLLTAQNPMRFVLGWAPHKACLAPRKTVHFVGSKNARFILRGGKPVLAQLFFFISVEGQFKCNRQVNHSPLFQTLYS